DAFLEPPYDRYTEGFWTEKILSQLADTSLELLSGEVSGEKSPILAVDRFFDVYERPDCWPAVKHGNLKTDGLAAILDRIEVWQQPQLPDIITLAERYGDRKSTFIHRYPFSVHLKWIDSYLHKINCF
ncbi:MAG: hypothetical protein ACE5PV_21985, partial [Candidatus Poribacteria bacterium]